jgi:hypothetical protein
MRTRTILLILLFHYSNRPGGSGLAQWELCFVGESVEDQLQLLAGKAFKSIPIQPANLAFVEEAK